MAAAQEANKLTLALQDKPQFSITMEVAGESVIFITMSRILPQQQSIKKNIEMNLINSRDNNNPALAKRVR